MAEAIRADPEQAEHGWRLLRSGEPYCIRGAGGDASLEQLAAAGANSVRTWSAHNVGDILDEAHALGLTVTVGIWLGPGRHGLDYNDLAPMREQLACVRETVPCHKDRPAVLLWGIGNEMEDFDAGDIPAILDAPGLARGSNAFLSGPKMEATSTWFGMFLDDGSRLAAVDVMTELWSGKPPADRAPAIGH